MDLAKVLQQLHEELENLNAAISSLERLQEAGKHRTKEPGWLEDISMPVEEARKRKGKARAKVDAPKQQGQGFSSESD
jgi:hypothetical protein